MAWVVYQAADREIVSGHNTEAEANAARGADTIGRVEDGAGNEVDLSILFRPGWYYHADKTVQPDPSFSGAALLQYAARIQRARICGIHQRLSAVAEYYPAADHALACTYVAYAHWGSRRVFMSPTLTAQVKLGWAQQSAGGIMDMPAGEEEKFFSIVRTWNAADRAARTPSAGIIICGLGAGFPRWNLAQVVGNSAAANGLAADPTTADELLKLGNGDWINDIT